MCVCTVLNGRVDHGPYQAAALTTAMRARGQTLMCCAVALEDLEIEVEGVPTLTLGEADGAGAAGAGGLHLRRGRVSAMERLSPDLMRVFITLPGDQKLPFVAGQYINIVLDDGARRAFSFASAPADPGQPPSTAGDVIELHVRRIPGGRYTTHVFERMKVGDTVDFEGPLGRFTLHDSQRPILFVAGATGFAPIKSILEDAFRRGIRRENRLYWGVRRPQDLYLPQLPEQWQREHANFKFIPVLSEPRPEDHWTGRTGLVHEAILQDFPSLAGNEIYACGSVKMVEAIFPKLKNQGAEEGMCFSDAFHISARSMALQAPVEPQK